MRGVYVSCLCVLMVVAFGEARSFSRGSSLNAKLKSGLFDELKTRQTSFAKKGGLEDGDKMDEAKEFELIGLHAASYVVECLGDSQLMGEVDERGWKLIQGDDNEYNEFLREYNDKPFFSCLTTARGVYFYENDPDLRPFLNEIFTMYKEAHVCESLSDLGERLKNIADLPKIVSEIVDYMSFHCDERTRQRESWDEPAREYMVNTATFDATMYAGQCIADNKEDEDCKNTVEAVKNYYSAWKTIYETEWAFEYYNEMYTCQNLEKELERIGQASFGSQIASDTIGSMREEIEKMTERECSDVLNAMPGKKAINGQKAGVFGARNAASNKNTQPLSEKMEQLKRILTNMMDKQK